MDIGDIKGGVWCHGALCDSGILILGLSLIFEHEIIN